ncbi:unnamed protein product [Fusarium graminearum]|uniref:Uncharacterized protein n=1 Tax=Gibberella zeae TaxID=5518 RepID=A0A4E9DEH0_GIBZA|nr:unnamed protein product [Fusarium graminearum]CAG1968299.1 unnamed protein product [Fusarium graminearum]CAG2013890.1 unnamed protein product [Fusarium graminearum]
MDAKGNSASLGAIMRSPTTASHAREVSVFEYAESGTDGRGSGKLGGGGANDGWVEVILHGVEGIEHVGGGVGSEVDEERDEERGKGGLGLGSPFAHGAHD